ncbi:hypothetical protein KUCAC02_017595 [Chaenocephalus aceratus]|uniref:Uncharacterized protein n=1 Tax=Chaenocephalus aceratus TaxID=36190 RepID=A0ACB9W1F4_CHAAC|nr:hypothetical protein KUCAC02_017595 [Chaenocephalus aceratus]
MSMDFFTWINKCYKETIRNITGKLDMLCCFIAKFQNCIRNKPLPL